MRQMEKETGLYTTTYVQEEEKKLLRLAGYVADAGNINKGRSG